MSKKLLMVLGVVFLLIGAIGFFSDPILGIFDVDPVHNVIHLVSGALALYFANKGGKAMKTFAIVFAVVYGLVTILGFVMGGGEILGLMEVNGADNILHLVITLAFLYVGFGKND